MSNFVPTAEMPIITAMQAKMLRALQHPSYLELGMLLGEAAKDLTTNNHGLIGVGSMQAAFLDDPDFEMFRLLQHVPRDLCASVIRGTVAYDFKRTNVLADRPATYSADGPGTYVCGMSIVGRQGKFLNISEINHLAAAIKKYIDAYDLWAVNKRWDMASPAHVDASEFVAEVDSQYGKVAADKQPRFVPSSDAAVRNRGFIQSLRKRANIALDPTRQVFQVQSPLMVGCSGEPISERVKSHHLGRSLTSTTYTWGLILSLIANVLDLTPIVTSVPVLRIYRKVQLPQSEKLVTLLAQSLITQTGFNVIAPGGQHELSKSHMSRGAMAEHREYVCARAPFLAQNLEQILPCLEHERRFAQFVRRLKNTSTASFDVTLGEIDAKMALLTMKADRLDDLRGQMHDELQAIEDRNERLRATAESRRELCQVVEKVVNALKEAQERRTGSGA